MRTTSQQQNRRIISLVAALLVILSPVTQSGSPLHTQAQPKDQLELSQPLTLRWEHLSGETVNLTPATDGERIYLPLAGGSLLSLSADDGQLIWKVDMGGELSCAPIADERAVYVASATKFEAGNMPQASGAVRALGREGGITQWIRIVPMPMRGAMAINETKLFGGASDGRVYALRKQSGEILWLTQLPTVLNSELSVIGSRLYVGSEDGTLYCLDQATGNILWRYRTRGAIRGRVAVLGEMIFFGSADGSVYAVDSRTGRLRWRARTGAAVQTVSSAGGVLLASSLDNFVYRFSPIKGARLWKHQLGGRLPSQPLIAQDGALFIPLSSTAGVVLDFRNGRQLNLLPLGEDGGVAAAPILAGKIVCVTTRQGLRAFSRPL